MFQNEINGLGDLRQLLYNETNMASFDAHVKYWFRGQARADLPLIPGVYRKDFLPPGSLERQRLRQEQRMGQDFRILSAGIRDADYTDVELYFLQQHYGMPTRLLDWTGNPLAALYFAVSGERDQDGEFFLLDALRFESTQSTHKLRFWGIADSRHPRLTQVVKLLAEFKDEDEFPDFIMPIRPDHGERRVSLQRSCFTFHVPKRPEVTESENDSLRRFRIPSTSKLAILSELALFGVDEFTIFGDLAHLSSHLKATFQRRWCSA